MSLKSFFDYLEIEKKYSSNTIEAYRNDLSVFARYLSDEFNVTNINNTNYSYIRSWIVDLVNKGISNRSVNRKVTSLNSYFKFVLKLGYASYYSVCKYSFINYWLFRSFRGCFR